MGHASPGPGAVLSPSGSVAGFPILSFPGHAEGGLTDVVLVWLGLGSGRYVRRVLRRSHRGADGHGEAHR